jgi:type I restriction enzyme S subunit
LGEYLFRLFQERRYNGQFEVNANGVTRFGLSVSTFAVAFVPVPTIEEQTAIANYLDAKTAQIDKLIAGKQKLIELLKEERTAIINQAVTKGIDPDVKLKPSGIEWLGEIPVRWEVKRLKYIATIKYGLGQPPNQKNDGLPLIRATNIQRGRIEEKDLIFVDPSDVPYDRDPVLRENDIIVVRSGAYTADSAIIPKEYEGAITGYDMVVRVMSANPLFVSYALLSDYVLTNQLHLQKLRAAQPHLNKEELGETFLLVPDKKQQQRIVEHIEEHLGRIDNTISKIEREIELLQEYRTALISEAVTGKIKVV